MQETGSEFSPEILTNRFFGQVFYYEGSLPVSGLLAGHSGAITGFVKLQKNIALENSLQGSDAPGASPRR
jgi:hypothetical protein